MNSVDFLQREIEVCYNSLANYNKIDKDFYDLNNKYNKIFNELVTYKIDNKKLFDNCENLFVEVDVKKKEIDYLLNVVEKIMENFINNDINENVKNLLYNIIENNRKKIYLEWNLNKIDKKLNNLKNKNIINNNNIEQSKIIDIYDLENEKQNLNLKLNKINKIIQSNEFQLENINKQ